jgi:hypothetical protein
MSDFAGPMSATRKQSIVDWLKRDFGRLQYAPSDESLAWLVDEAERATRLYLGRRNPLRPAAEARQLAVWRSISATGQMLTSGSGVRDF